MKLEICLEKVLEYEEEKIICVFGSYRNFY